MRAPGLERAFKRWLVRLFGWIIPDAEYRPDQLDLDPVRSILVVRQHDQLGDLLLSTPAIHALRERFPQAFITVIARVYTHSVLLNNPDIGRVLVFPEKPRLATPRRLWALLKGLRIHYDLAVVLNTVSHSLSSDVLAWMSGARWRLGSAEHPFAGARANLFYNIVSPAPASRVHETMRSLAIVEHIGARADDAGERLGLTPAEEAWGEEVLWKNHLLPEKTIGLNLGAYQMPNRWPYRSYAALADWLAGEHGFQVAVFWGPREEELGELFLGAVNVEVAPLPGLNLRQLASVFRRLRLVVCNDTGIMHLSAAAGTPTFAVFGRNDPEYWRPLNRNFYGVWGPDKTKASAELETVKSGIRRMLARTETV
jgi:ADP-heptose:LPS heptosyltransferase